MRATLLEQLDAKIGLEPCALLAAKAGDLARLISKGGIDPPRRAAKLRAIAELTLEHADGDLAAALASRSLPTARRLLKKFPGIGDPGADKLLLFGGYSGEPALESNGLRVLERLGHVPAGLPYAAQYRIAKAFLDTGLPSRPQSRISAFQLLQLHGRQLCKRTEPLCPACPLKRRCAYYRMRF